LNESSKRLPLKYAKEKNNGESFIERNADLSKNKK